MSNVGQEKTDVLEWLIKHAPALITSWEKVRRYFKRKPVEEPTESTAPLSKILILGCGGVGKSTLAKILTGEANDLLADIYTYKESLGEEENSVSENASVITVLPGQKLRRSVVWPEFLKGIESGVYQGVILVDCFGHHTLGELEVTSHKLWKNDIVLFRKEYLAAQRADELEVAKLLTHSFKQRQSPMWLLHVTTKADLWWGKRSQCSAHIASETYAALNSSLPNGSRSEQVQTCLAISNVNTKDGKCLFEHSKDYDQVKRLKSLELLTAMVLEMQKWCSKC